MEPYDILMVVVIAVATIWGLWKGLAWQVASLASFVASYFVAYHFAEQLAPYISEQAPWNKFLAMLILYLGTSFIIWTLFRLVSGTMERIKLRDFDRHLGGMLGVVKGVVLCVVITFFAVTLSKDGRDAILKSQSGYYIALLLDKADPVMPKEVHDVLGPYLEKLHDQLHPDHQLPQTAHEPAFTTR